MMMASQSGHRDAGALGELDGSEAGRQRRAEYSTHRCGHTNGHVQRGINGERHGLLAGQQRSADEGGGTPDAGTNKQRGADQPHRHAKAYRHSGGNDFRQGDHQQSLQSQLLEHGATEGVVTDAQNLGHKQREAAGQESREGKAQQDRTVCQLRAQGA